MQKIVFPKVGNFRFRKVKNDILMTNDGGNWTMLDQKDFALFVAGKMDKSNPLQAELVAKGFLNLDKKEVTKLAGQYLALNRSLFEGPSLFIIVLTVRCNHRCLYCQVIPEKTNQKGFDMDKETARKSVDLIFKTPSKFIRIEFQGGEPLLNWSVLKYVVKYAKEVNATRRKNLKISLVSNLTEMDDKKLKFLLDNHVDISCSFDGPAAVHNRNRIYLDGKNGHQIVSERIKKVQKTIRINNESSKKKVDQLNAVLTVSRFSLSQPLLIIDEYIKKGFDTIFVRPLSPFGLSRVTLKTIGYTAEEFISYYKKSLDYILKINLTGKTFIERATFYALKKIIAGDDPNYFEMRSPCGAGIGQMAFDYDGKIYTCDEGRMAARMGHVNFQLGDVKTSSYNELIDNGVTKTMCLSSCLDNHVSCQDCAYKPYCGVCPLANFIEHGTIFPQLPNTDRCKINKAMFDYIFLKMQNKKYKQIFEKWLEIKA